MPALREVLHMPNASTYKYSKFFRKKQGKKFSAAFLPSFGDFWCFFTVF